MNKSDVEKLGYILSDSESWEEAKERVFDIDKRIKDEFLLFEDVAGRHIKVEELFNRLMVDRYGPGWSCLREKPPFSEVMEEARRSVYGEDYDLVFT